MIPPRKIASVLLQSIVISIAAPLPVAGEEAKPTSAQFHAGVGVPVPNVNLPETIPAPEGELTLFADYKNAGGGKVPLYLVNRTTGRVSLSAQDGDIYLKLERKPEDGHWERVQTHQDSWCGNSYYPVELDPGNHFVFSGYFPAKGTGSQVRFRSYGSTPLVSNEGEGFFLEEDRLAAGVDPMALRELPASLQVYFRTDSMGQPKAGDSNAEETFLSALRLVALYRESRYVREKAEAYLAGDGGDSASPASPDVAGAIRGILGKEWPAVAMPGSLVEAALAELPDHPHPAWAVLDEFLRKGFALEPGAGNAFETRVAEELEKALHRGKPREIEQAANLIGAQRFAGEHLDDAFLIKWASSSHEALVKECANALSSRKRFDELVGIGSDAVPSVQLIILRALASGGVPESGARRARNPDSKLERDFWIRCAKEQPIATVNALYYIGLHGAYNSFNLSIHEPLRDFLIQEAKKPSESIDGWEIGQVVAFIGAWKRKEDVEVFRSLLDHPAVQRSEGTKSSRPGVRLEFLRYRVRVEARQILLAMGEAVSEGIVLEEERVIP